MAKKWWIPDNWTKMNIELAFWNDFVQWFSIFARLPTAWPLLYMISLPISTVFLSELFFSLSLHALTHIYFPVFLYASKLFECRFFSSYFAAFFHIFETMVGKRWNCWLMWLNGICALIVSRPNSNDQWYKHKTEPNKTHAFSHSHVKWA